MGHFPEENLKLKGVKQVPYQKPWLKMEPEVNSHDVVIGWTSGTNVGRCQWKYLMRYLMRYLTKFGTELKKQTTIMAERAKSTQLHWVIPTPNLHCESKITGPFFIWA